MKTLIWKESRDIVKPGAFCGLAFAIGLVVLLASAREAHYPFASAAQVRHPMSGEFQLLFIYATAIVGLVIGLAQIFTERDRDIWAFLVHRPVSRSQIFLAKVIVGLGTYLLCVGIPYAFVPTYFAVPGNSPIIFHPDMLLPGIVDIAFGSVFYFAGLLVAVRKARWYGTRLMPCALGILIGILLHGPSAPSFAQSLVMVVSAAIVLALGARAAYVTAGEDGAMNPWQRFAAAFPSLVGLSVVTSFALGGLMAVGFPIGKGKQSYFHYSVHVDGSVYKKISNGGRVVTMEDMDGNEIPRNKHGGYDLKKDFPKRLPTTYLKTAGTQKKARVNYGFRNLKRFYSSSKNLNGVLWYFSDQSGRIVGFNVRERQFVAHVSAQGFIGGTPPKARDADSFDSVVAMREESHWVTHERTLYRTYPLRQELMKLYTAQPQHSPGPLRSLYSPAGNVSVMLTGPKNMIALDNDGKKVVELELPHAADYRHVQLGRLQSGDQWLVHYTEFPGGKADDLIQVLANDGSVIREQTLQPWMRDEIPWGFDVRNLMGVYTPPVLAAVIVSVELSRPASRRSLILNPATNGERKLRRQVLSQYGLQAFISTILGILFLRRRGMNVASHLPWLGMCSLFGIPGFLFLCLMNPRPRTETCHACGGQRSIEHTQCAICGETSAPPETDGTEIFANLAPTH